MRIKVTLAKFISSIEVKLINNFYLSNNHLNNNNNNNKRASKNLNTSTLRDIYI